MSSLFNLSYGLLWLLFAIQGLILLVLVRELAELRRSAVNGSPFGTSHIAKGARAPDFSALDLRTGQLLHSTVFHGRRTVLLFLSTECMVCRQIASRLALQTPAALQGLAIYCRGTVRGCQSRFLALPDTVPVLTQEEQNVPADFRVNGFPLAIAVDESWRVLNYQELERDSDVLQIVSTLGIEPRVQSVSSLQPA